MKKIIQLTCILFASFVAFSQTPGLIVKPAQSPGNSVLDPNADGYVSATNQGFNSNDIGESELPFVSFPGFEIPDDPIVGPSSSFNDFVVIGNEYGTSLYNDGTNLIFRMRLSRLLPNTKGYTVLIDTDNRFGQSGPNADPNWTAGNRGFEIEILLTTNDLVRVYNIDGASTPGTPIASYSYNTHCQKSFALSFTNGYRDAFYDFYVPLSVLTAAPLNLNLNAPIRFVAITSMNPASVLTANVSDVYGYPALRGDLGNTLDYMMEHTVAVSVNDINNGIPQLKTEKPVISNFMQDGGTLVEGTSTEAPGTIIYIYRNGNLVDSTTVQVGGNWTINLGTSYLQGDSFIARALATDKTISDNSNEVIVAGAGCTAYATSFSIACLTRKGVSITPTSALSSGTVTVFNSSGTQVFTLNVADAIINIPNTGDYFFPFNTSISNCNSGPNELPAGLYRVRFTQPSTCNIPDLWEATNNTALPALSPTPVITSTNLFTTSSVISGTSTATAGSIIYVYQNGEIIGNAIVQTGGTWSMTPPPSTLVLNGNITARVQQAGLQLSAVSNTVVVQQQVAVAPVVNSPINVGATLITGTSVEAPGSIVSVRINNTVVGTATVQADGTWSYNHNTPLTSGQQINATVSATGKLVSAVGNTVTVLAQSPPPTFSSSIFETTTSLSGGMSTSVPDGTIIYMIVDGAVVAQTTTTSNTWTITGFPSGELYAGAEVSFSAQVSGLNVSTQTGPFTVICVNPDENISYTAIFPNQVGQFLTVEINNPENDIIYTLLDANTLQPISPSAYSIGNDFTLTSNVYAFSGTYEVVVEALKAYEPSCNAILADSMEFVVLPVTWLSITAERNNVGNLITWQVTNEKNHSHYEVEAKSNAAEFKFIGKVSFPASDGVNKTYRIIDKTAYSYGIQYYRVKQVDLNGAFEYSKIVHVRTNQNEQRNIAIYPNPTKDLLFVQIQSKVNEKIELAIMDITGKLIQSKQLNLTNSNMPFELSLSDYAPGTYFVKLNGSDWSQTERIVKF